MKRGRCWRHGGSSRGAPGGRCPGPSPTGLWGCEEKRGTQHPAVWSPSPVAVAPSWWSLAQMSGQTLPPDLRHACMWKTSLGLRPLVTSLLGP